jgi:type II secretory pathway predicted ATPase ExeA
LIEEARQRLVRAIERGDGPGLVVGASGTGKTLLLEVLAARFCNQFDVAMLFSAQLCTRRALLQAILFELELPYRYHDEGELRLTLLDYLLRSERCPNGILLLVDEAPSLPVRLLEEIRLMSNLVRDGQPRVRVVLAGGPPIEELLARGELETFQQRIGMRCYLGPLSQNETSQYVRGHLAAVEMNADATFDSAALDAIFEATDGIPRNSTRTARGDVPESERRRG